ncbi:amidase signature domain-containing protein [Cladorrhinum sp. PSN332]|nr:amidase signature domain-containing protein [Cladorrhinum sp. PSN332]
MNTFKPLYTLTASQVLVLIKNNTITVQEYARSLLERTRTRDDLIHAWEHLDPELVLEQAKALDKTPQDKRGPLHGVAVGIQDVMNTKDMPTEFGSPIYRGHRPGSDASAVAILRAAGALIFGKTTTTEFAIANSGPETANPQNTGRTPGGSSCGSAAAVADFQVPLSLGTQTGGSVIRPASFTGVFAMKPTHNAISLEGIKPIAPTYDTLGFFARSIEDLQLLADVFEIKDDRKPEIMDVADLSVALVRGQFWDRAGAGTISAIEEACTILEHKRGVTTIPKIGFPPELNLERLKLAGDVIMTNETRLSLLKECNTNGDLLSPQVSSMAHGPGGSSYPNRALVQAHDIWGYARRLADGTAAKYSVIITPSAVDEAPFGLDDMGCAAFKILWTRLHMPVVNIPAFVGENGMPIGISLVGGRFQDQHLLSVAKVISDVLVSGGPWEMQLEVPPDERYMTDYI